MKIILLEDVKNLGTIGDVVKVSDGYARNMLLPKKMAMIANEKNMKQLEINKKKMAKEHAENLEQATIQAELISSKTVKFESKAGEGGKLFGSVTSKDLAEALKEQHGIDVDKRKIQLDSSIKNAGETSVDIKLFPGVTASLKVIIEADE